MDLHDMHSGDLWDKIGFLDELEIMQVLTTLYVTYEKQQQCEPENAESQQFFKNLELAVSQVSECNLNRR